MKHGILAALVIAGALLAQGCQLLDSGESFEVPDDYGQSDAVYTLIYSTVGYDAGATKHVLVRQNDTAMPAATGLAFEWRLVTADTDEVVETGLAQFGGTSWSIPVWVADFTDVRRAGTYRMTFESTNVELATGPFRVGDFLLSARTLVPIALDAAEVRAAPIELDNGFFEPNSMEGTSFAHAEFLLGLLAVYQERRSSLTEDMRQRTRAAIERGFDYLMLLSDPATGQMAHAAQTRPFAFGENADDTVAGARALARYATVFQLEDPGRADRAYRRARLADTWLLDEAPQSYAPWAQAQVAYDLYSFIGDLALLDRAVVAVRTFVGDYDLAAMDRPSGDTMPHFETMRRLWQTLAEHPDRALWEETARRVARQYGEMSDAHPLTVVPPGVTAEGQPSAQEQWDAVQTEPPPGDGDSAMIANEWFMARAIDAASLARMVEDERLEKSATSHMLWITGLNAGVPSDRVPGSDSASGVRAASFLFGLDAEAVQPAPSWEWQRARPLADIAAGFRRAFTFDESSAAGSSSISRSGLWLQAVVTYEELIHPGARATTPEEPSERAVEMRVASMVRSDSALGPTVTITVVDGDGTPLAETYVSAVWIGTRGPGQPPEETILADGCRTVAGGSCSLTLDPSEMPGVLPVRLVVTNLKHGMHAFVPGENVLPAPTVFE